VLQEIAMSRTSTLLLAALCSADALSIGSAPTITSRAAVAMGDKPANIPTKMKWVPFVSASEAQKGTAVAVSPTAAPRSRAAPPMHPSPRPTRLLELLPLSAQGFQYGLEIAVVTDTTGKQYAIANKLPPFGQPATFGTIGAGTITDPVTLSTWDLSAMPPFLVGPAPLGVRPPSRPHPSAARRDGQANRRVVPGTAAHRPHHLQRALVAFAAHRFPLPQVRQQDRGQRQRQRQGSVRVWILARRPRCAGQDRWRLLLEGRPGVGGGGGGGHAWGGDSARNLCRGITRGPMLRGGGSLLSTAPSETRAARDKRRERVVCESFAFLFV